MIANCLTMEHRQDRRDLFIEQAKEQGFEYKFWYGEKPEFNVYNSICRGHKQIIRNAKHLGLPEVLIMEDDIKFTAPGAFQFFLSNKPDDFDLYLGGIYWGRIQPDNTVKDFAALHCYIVNERFYDTFLGVRECGDLDRTLNGLGKYVVCNPFAAIQYNGFSDHQKAPMNYDPYLKNRKLFGV